MIDTLVLGTRDPEMDAIGRVAIANQIDVVWAKRGGQPVRYEDMYLVDEPKPRPGLLWVECSPAEGKARIDFVDHHEPGDPGFGQPPETYWESSSLGQVWLRLCPYHAPPPALRTIAAVDHCPQAAFAGLCKGVDPEMALAFSVRQISIATGHPLKAILRRLEQQIRRFKERVMREIHGARLFLNEGPPLLWHDWLLLREAGLRHGVAVLSPVADGGSVWYRMAGHTTPALVEAFVAGSIIEGLDDLYGDPHRGYAGGRHIPVLV